jgi:hypothetical protein
VTHWTSDELDKIGHADELEITTTRRDGTSRKPVLIWVVREGDGLYVRSGYGDRALWYRTARRSREGHISAGGIEKDVRFEDADPALNDQIDAAYRSKYLRHGAEWVNLTVSSEGRSTTINWFRCKESETCAQPSCTRPVTFASRMSLTLAFRARPMR